MMPETELDAALFFNDLPGAYPIYLAFRDAVLAAHPDTKIKVQKTQITFYNPRVFACASLLRARRKAELPKPWLTVTLGLPYRLGSPRAAICTEPYPGRWTTHIVLGAPEEVDEELLHWVDEAYAFAAGK
ncbi:MAG: hypothetical protein IKO22_01070 [Oscillospiraceae bacterium]|nr:hypothetical protein [Oscillospiraceae bacterium]